jgi:hypothetical protein
MKSDSTRGWRHDTRGGGTKAALSGLSHPSKSADMRGLATLIMVLTPLTLIGCTSGARDCSGTLVNEVIVNTIVSPLIALNTVLSALDGENYLRRVKLFSGYNRCVDVHTPAEDRRIANTIDALPMRERSAAESYLKGEAALNKGNTAEAADRFRRAASADDSAGIWRYRASYELGTLIYLGAGLPRRADEAIRLLTLAADHGVMPALLVLANGYERGDLFPKDPAEAARLWRRAAEWRPVPSAEAMYRLGLAYTAGEGVRADDGEAFHWMEMITRANVAPTSEENSPTSLAVLRQKAITWIHEASGRGVPQAQEWVEVHDGKPLPEQKAAPPPPDKPSLSPEPKGWTLVPISR